MTKENPEKTTVTRTQSRGETSNGLDRVREATRRDKNLRLNNLLHHVTLTLLRDSYYGLKRNAAPGVDDVTWKQYGERLEEKLAGLHGRVQSGR
jgi:hypothetical protein